MADAFFEPPWTFSADTNTYHRALLGIEVSHDTVHTLADGCAEPCFGVSFSYPFGPKLLIDGLREALGRLRFEAPLLAAAITGELGQREWHYQCASGPEDVVKWATDTLIYHHGISSEDFALKTVMTRATYPMGTFSAQQFACHLLSHGPTTYTIFQHGTHAICDGVVTLNAIYCMFATLTNPEEGTAVKDLKWGSEWKNLPTSLIEATGGAPDGWREGAAALAERKKLIVDKPTPPQGIYPQRDRITIMGRLVRVQRKIGATDLAHILRWLKLEAFSVHFLLEAAVVLATFEYGTRSTTYPEDAHVTFDIINVDLQKKFVPPYNNRTRMASALSMIAASVSANQIGSGPVKSQLLKIMPLIREQYTAWLLSPYLPFMDAWAPPTTASNPYSPVVSNLGIVDRVLPLKWTFAGGQETIDVTSVTISDRPAYLTRPALHAWGLAGEFHLQCQLSDMCDAEYLEGYVDRVIDIMMSVTRA